MTRRPVSLGRRLQQLLAAVALVTLLIAALTFWPLINRAADSAARQSLGRTADLVAETISGYASSFSGGVRHVPTVLNDRVQLLLEQQQAQGYLVFSQAKPQAPLTQADVDAVTSGRTVSEKRWHDGEFYFIEGQPVMSGIGVLLAQPTQVAEDVAKGVILRLGLAMLLGLSVAVVVGSLVARRMTRPLADAANAANAMSGGQRDIRVAPEGPAEVQAIAVSLNQLAAGLAESEDRQKEFFLTVSHELRTPLTSLKGYSEALADGVVPEGDVPEVAGIMRAEADHLDRLVADLLDLARLGAVDVRVEPVASDLTGIGRDAAATWSGRVTRAGLVFGNEVAAGPVWSLTDPIRVRQIIDNLMENALRVTAEGGPIVLRVEAAPEPGWGLVQVRDGGPGLSADDLRVAFEPGELYARYRGVRKVGSGVGLALVNRLAQRLGGAAQAGVAPEGGACFTVHLPLMAESGPSEDRADDPGLSASQADQAARS